MGSGGPKLRVMTASDIHGPRIRTRLKGAVSLPLVGLIAHG